MTEPPTLLGFSGRLAAFFVRSKLSILLIVFSLVLGLLAVALTPREDEPTITVAVADVWAAYPGRGEKEVDERLARPLGSLIREIPTVDHVTSVAGPDGALLTVQFRDRVSRETALIQLHERIQANLDRLPPGVAPPLVKHRGVEDVSDLSVVLSSQSTDVQTLRRLAVEMASDVRRIPDVSRVDVTGGEPRAIRVDLDARRLAERGLTALQVVQAVQAGNVQLPAGQLSGAEGTLRVEAGTFLRSADDAGALIIGVNGAGLIYLRDVARVTDGIADPSGYVSALGQAENWSVAPAVTLTAIKIRGSNAAVVTRDIRSILDPLARQLLPSDVRMTYVHDSGKLGMESVNQALEHLAIAVAVAIVLVLLALGWREALVTALVLPVTLVSIPMAYAMTGFTLNRITLAAMVFAIGLLIDNAIVVIENIHRHYQAPGRMDREQVAVVATQEIGAPTILATIMVVMALVPTAFVTGMTGQYLRALPVGSSIGMMFSLFIALTLVPYLCVRILHRGHGDAAPTKTGRKRKGSAASVYSLLLGWILESRKHTLGVYAIGIALLAAAVSLLPVRVALFRFLADKDQDQVMVMIDYPTGTTLEAANAMATDAARLFRDIPEVESCQTYVGVPGPQSFQGVARHYELRTQPYQAELQIQLREDRHRPSQKVASAVRDRLASTLAGQNADFTVAEIPSGPPSVAPLVAEVYAPSDADRIALARSVKSRLKALPGVADVDWVLRPGPRIASLEVLHQQAAARGVVAAQAALTTRTLFQGDTSTWAQFPHEHEPVQIAIRQNRSLRAGKGDLESLTFNAMTGGPPVPATEIGEVREREGQPPLMRMDLQPVIMVMGVSTGEGPLYSALDFTRVLESGPKVAGSAVRVQFADGTPDIRSRTVKWGGDLSLLRDMLRDLGGAFAFVLLLIYGALVVWYESFITPVIIMLPIPLIGVGVIPAHALLGKPIDSTGLIGVIALAGIMVRNSILLVDFTEHKIRCGFSVREAVIRGSRTRMRPIAITALAVVLGESVLLLDSLLKSLGIALVFGGLVSTILTLFIVPAAYYQLGTWHQRKRSRLAQPSPSEVHP